jgi:hypothetical protein
MKPLKLVRAIAFGISMFALFLISISVRAEGLSVAKVTRLTHPAYRALNLWYGARYPWNKDHTRIMLYESTAFTHPSYNVVGRGLVWGFITDLKSWTSLSEYQSVAKPIPNEFYPTSAYWSPFTGEENFIYGMYTPDKTIRKHNVDKSSMTTIISYDPKDGTDVSNAECMGWTSDNKLVVLFAGRGTCCGYVINVQNATRTRFSSQPNVCTAEGMGWPWDPQWNGHAHTSPDKLLKAEYGYGYIKGYGTNCSFSTVKDPYYPNNPVGEHIGHVSWKGSNDWYLGSDIGKFDSCNYTSPHLDTFGLYQIYSNQATKQFTYGSLLKKQGAGLWCKSGNYVNYHSLPIATIRSDGNQIFFMSTDGKYSYDDYQYNGSQPWGTEGIFLVDIAPASQPSDTTPPAPPSVTGVQ